MNPLKQLEQCGQSPWLDFVRRSLIEKGELAKMVENDGLKGVTSNPSIFEKAIGHSNEYDADFTAFEHAGDHGISAAYEHLAIGDIRAAADALRTVYDATGGRDGYISLEVSPYLANDTEATVAEARRLWKTVGKPNLMVKVPATKAGVPAIQTLIGEGLNINVTLLFGIPAYEAVAHAYIAGLEHLAKTGGDVSRSASVASFFVSRIDSLVDKKLDAAIAKGADKASLDKLRGKAAIANAKMAYEHYKHLFSGATWDALAAKGAKAQRLLWASTSTKNPAYPDTMYVDTLIGRDTVNTMPPATMDAFRDHGKAVADTVEQDLDGAKAIIRALDAAGVSILRVADELVEDGVQQFADAFDQLLGAVAMRRRKLVEGDRPPLDLRVSDAALKKAIDDTMEKWRHDGTIRRLWRSDKTVWSNADEDHWTGWLSNADAEMADIGTLESFARDVESGGYKHVVLLGMGGSSLGPEVLAETFGHRGGWPAFHMLDSTDPAQVKAVADACDLPHTLAIVSSKSGSTLEPNIFLAYFFDRMQQAVGDAAGKHFVAVTDPGSSLEKHAQEKGFAHIFHGVKTSGGRYSVLSKFGLVPAAAIGLDLRAALETVQRMARSCAEDAPPSQNPGVQLGIAMGVAAKHGRDKVTIIASPHIHAIGAWLEQLLAESTGKQGKGLIPIADEPLGKPEDYGSDRFFAYLELADGVDPHQRAAVDAIEKAGHPVARIAVAQPMAIWAEFYRWAMATAVAGSVIGINPFDQPDVEASKIATRKLTTDYEKTGKLPSEEPVFRADGVAVYADAANAKALGQHNALSGYIKSHLARAGAGDYVALLAYIQRDGAHTGALQEIRTRIRDAKHTATAVGFGPRFLHSTGQAYKGGPNSGVFMQITCDDPADVPVPGSTYTFGVVKAAQALGDLQVLEERGRRALRLHLHDVDAGLGALSQAVKDALG
ncbi:MAG TPA: bifunctional transaldolase/phosoglucose isomerase [Acidisphaera sp.]|nr:bifunctional transaldolase/phosoglucose isomerase [Acidisphaera sp.]